MTEPELKNSLFPLPKEVRLTGGEITLKRYTIRKEAEAETLEAACEALEKKLAELGIEAGEDADTELVLKLEEAPERVTIREQGYRLTVEPGRITLSGFGSRGLYYAAVTLRQMLKTPTVPCAEILDWPDLEERQFLIETRYSSDLLEKEDWLNIIDECAEQKVTAVNINLQNCWCVQYDGRVSEFLYVPLKGRPELQTPFKVKYYSPKQQRWVEEEKLPPIFRDDFFDELIKYAKKRGIVVFPSFNSYGHNTLIPRTYPQISAKNESGEPELVGFCTSNPETYEILFDIYDQIIDRYLAPNGIDKFSIVLDEVWAEIALNANDIFRRRSPWCKCPACRDKAPGELFIAHAIRVMQHLKQKGMRKIYICCDMLIDHGPNGVGELNRMLMDALKAADLTNEVVVLWWTYADLWDKLMFHSTKPELGLHRITSPWNGYYNWIMQCNSIRDVYMMAKMAIEEKCDGMDVYSSWDRCFDRSNRAATEFTWNFHEAGTVQDMTDRYLMQKFPTGFEQARRAFQLFDFITEERIEKLGGDSSCLANYFMLRDRLAYYFYSYVDANKPYPRIFPGEALQKICEHREDHVRAMYSISGMAKEAKALWESVAQTEGCDRALAEYYAYEAENYLVLVDDYLAMLRMMELAEKGDYALIAQMAARRRDTRIALMARLQAVKPLYLQPFQLRNHSIFMQFFEDLRSYLERTPEQEIHLDFFDMRYLASERFMNLR